MAESRKEYVLALAIGAIVGVGATMLLAPRTKKKRRKYPMPPSLSRARKRARRLRRSIRDR